MQAPGRKPNAEKWHIYEYSHIQHHGIAESSTSGSGLARAGGLKPQRSTHSTQLNQAFKVHRQIWSQARTKRIPKLRRTRSAGISLRRLRHQMTYMTSTGARKKPGSKAASRRSCATMAAEIATKTPRKLQLRHDNFPQEQPPLLPPVSSSSSCAQLLPEASPCAAMSNVSCPIAIALQLWVAFQRAHLGREGGRPALTENHIRP